MITSSRTPSIVGYIISLITNGQPSTKSWHCETVLQKNHLSLELPGVVNPSLLVGLTEYLITLSSGEVIYIAAADSMDAAYSALELSEDRNTTILDIEIVDEQTTLFSE